MERKGRKGAGRSVEARKGMDGANLLIYDIAAQHWCCGWASDSGPSEIVAAGRPMPAQLASMFEALEAVPHECAVLLSELPGASSQAREEVAVALYSAGVPALWIVASPLLALFNIGRDTATVVDMHETHAYIMLVYLGHAVLDAVTVHPLSDAASGMRSLDEAVVATVALADIGLRAELLQNVVVVGLGSKDAETVQRLREGVQMSLAAAGAPWSVRLVANADRTLATWLGAAMVGTMQSAQARFVTRDEHRMQPAVLHERCIGLACQTLAAQLAQRKAYAAADEAAADRERAALLQRAKERDAEASVWWVEQMPSLSADERERRCTLHVQRHVLTAAAWWAWHRSVKIATPARASSVRARRKLVPGGDVTILSCWHW